MFRSVFVVVGIAAAAIASVFFFQLSSTPVRLVRLNDSPHSVTLHAGAHLTQRIHLSVGTYSSIAIFSNDQLLDGRTVALTISDRSGAVIARGNGLKTSYRPSANVMRIEIPTTWFSVAHDDFYVIDLFLPEGQPLPLRAMPRDENLPAVSKLSINGVPQPAILSISISQVSSTLFGMQQGVLVGAAFSLGVLLLSFFTNEKRKMWAAVCLIFIFAPLTVTGYLLSYDELGIADWDYYVPLHDSYRKALLEYHTFPLWNPYPCGGTAGLADPEFPVFSPTFLLELLFGVPYGVRAAIVLTMVVGATGMLALSRSLGRSVEASLIAALAVAFGTVNLLEVTEGHVNIFAAMWIPWILWSYLAAYRGKMRPIVCGVFLALTFLGGGIYLLMYTGLAFIGLTLLVGNPKRSIRVVGTATLWALGFSAFKLVPVLFWLDQFPDDAYAASAYTLPWIVDILFRRHLHGAYVIANQASGWHEYGAYVGYGVLALALVGASTARKNRVVRSLVVACVAAIFLSTLGPQLQPLFDHLWFFPRSSISRFILFAVIPMGILASYGVDRLARMLPWGPQVRLACIAFIAIDIISLTYQLSEQAFVLPHVVPTVAPAPYPLAFTPQRFDATGDGSRTTRSVDAYMAGYGTMVYCSVLGPQSAVRVITDVDGDTYVMPLDRGATATLTSWDYNKVSVHVESPRATSIVINTNYADGWTANGQKASIVDNRVAASVPAGSSDVHFVYQVPGLRLGLLITVSTFIFLLFFYLTSKKKEYATSE